MLTVNYNIPCARCNEVLPMVVEQNDRFRCEDCDATEVLCHACRTDPTCSSCGKGELINDADRLKRQFPGMIF